jgi:uncharacterized protein (DUF2147 family)
MVRLTARIAAVLLLAPLCCAALLAQAADMSSPVGRWKTIDDATGKAKAIVVIREDDGKLSASIEKVLDTDQPGPNPVCLACEGALKNQPLQGLRFLWEMKKDGNQWAGGQILDPHNGKVYRCILALDDGGRKLKVRGFIGFALLGRTEYWQRAD